MKESNSLPKPKRNAKAQGISIKNDPNKSEYLLAGARALTGPRVASALAEIVVAKKLTSIEFDLPSIGGALREASDRVKAGDLGDAESMLYSQASSLNLLYAELNRRAFDNLGSNYFEAGKQYLSLAMKAQNQCRMTLETLGNIKHPPAVYARQANINNGGHQQVNNGAASRTPATENKNPPTKLVGELNGTPMDTGAPGNTSRQDTSLEAMDTLDRAKVA